MEGAITQQYRISDFLEWDEKKQLRLNPYFQRRSVWTQPAKVFLIDTILRGMPIPKVYIRTQIDLKTRRSFREVVDGQQRLRAIFDFAADQVRLTARAKEFAGKTYSTLPTELQETFLSYALSVDQLINASDSDVLEVFARINAYTVSLNPPELRHAQFQGNFKWAVHEAARRWEVLWTEIGVISLRQRLRMLDDSFMAELFIAVMRGLVDGGQRELTRLYSAIDPTFPDDSDVPAKVDEALNFIIMNFRDVLASNHILASAPHFLMLFAAVVYAQFGLPGDGSAMPPRDPVLLTNIDVACQNLETLADILASEEAPANWESFWSASKTSTQRIASRRVRLRAFVQALLPEPL